MSHNGRILSLVLGAVLACQITAADEPPVVTAETPVQAKARHARVAERRAKVHILCHRGASEFAHENTLEAYRASFELGADGNEIDIRATKDGVLVCFHDDMLDQLLVAYGDASDYTWEELRRFAFREPGTFGDQCRIPTLVEVLELHRKHAGLIHLDIKRPNLDQAIARLLDQFDLWDHVAYCNSETGGVILKDPRLKLCRYKAGLYLDRSEVFPEAIAAAIHKPGEGLIVDDPRGAIVALGRKLGAVSTRPVSPQARETAESQALPNEAELIAALRDAADWNVVAQTDSDRLAAGRRINTRAQAADQLTAIKSASAEAFAALDERVQKRSLHKDWLYHGVDGACALRSLIVLQAPQAADAARFVLWRDDPALASVADPRFSNPRAWTDFRVKMVVFPALAHLPGVRTEQLCRDYLALDDEAAMALGPQQFEEAARTLLAVSPTAETALELMNHRLQVVRGRAILDCLARGQEVWARAALEQGAKPALSYLTSPVATHAEDWAHWRGPNRNGLVGESSGWEEGGWSAPREIWRKNVGEGSTSPLVVGGKVFVMGWAGGKDRLRCLELKTGKELWRQEYESPRFGRKAEGDQGLYAAITATPEYDAATGLLFTLGVDGDLIAWNSREAGRQVWKRRLYDEFDVPKRPRVGRSGHRDYGYTSSPLVQQEVVIVEVGAASGNLIGFDSRTGETRWQSQNKSPPGHNGGPVPITVENTPCVAVHTFEGLHVARIDRGHEGETVATYPWKTDFANNIASLTVAGDSVLMTSHYNQERTARLRISLSGATVVWEQPLASKVCSPIVLEGHVYFAWEQLVCLDFATGKVRWRGGRTGDPGSCIGTSDGRLIAWYGNGTLLLAESVARSPDKLQILAQREVLSETDAWPHVALADGHLLCKDRAGNLVCLALERSSP